MAKTVLVVDDEKSIVDILCFNLKKEGFETTVAFNGEEALEKYEAKRPDLILLDVMLPLLDGFEVCRRIRQSDKITPIIMLTAREEETDKVLGLDIGADDYITKPFSIQELSARIKANIRKTDAYTEESGAFDLPGREKADGFVIDKERFDVFIDGRSAELTQREFELVCFMAANPGKVYSREELLVEVWQFEYLGDLRTVDVAMRRLREKVEDNPSQPRYIMTKRGAGYYFN
jgi:two-component system response regulator VicR